MNNYKLQETSVWKFIDRGKWATHNPYYRGNWSPHIPRNLILKYTKENDVVADLFLGGGTTLIETKILNRNGIGVDINIESIKLSKSLLNFYVENNSKQILKNEDSRNTSIESNTVDLICMHPPYANVIKYSNEIKGDLSLLPPKLFLKEWDKVAKESKRILKKGKVCSFMIGDIRMNGCVYPLGFKSLEVFLNNGFSLKEIIIKEQYNCKLTSYWKNKSKQYGFYLLAHEYIFILFN
ncbi:MAG: site-specific DNA-methyltransferase [Erysipelotrichaceae bacterium]|nr:site-specific DNA-methyltransferase [Erysipelotrichaceae bacterium]